MKTVFKQSRNWSEPLSLKDLIEKSEFIFTDKLHKGNRPKIVMKEFIGELECNCFELDNDAYGIEITSWSKYHLPEDHFWKNEIVKKAVTIDEKVRMIIEFLIEWGAVDCVNPQKGYRYYLNKWFGIEKDVLFTIEH